MEKEKLEKEETGGEAGEVPSGDVSGKTTSAGKGDGERLTTPAEAAYGKLRIYFWAVAVLSAVAAAARSLAVLFSFDAEPGYFRTGLLPAFQLALTAVTFVIILSVFLFVPKELPGKRPGFGSGYFISTFAGFMLAFEAGYRIYLLAGGRFAECVAILSGSGSGIGGRNEKICAVLTLVIPVVSACSSALFFMRASTDEGEISAGRRSARLVMGIFPALRAILGFSLLYFDLSKVMNGDNNLAAEAGLIMIMLFFLAENRMEFGGEKSLPRAYVAAGLAAFLLAGTAGISAGIGFFAGKTGGEMTVEALYMTVAGIYALIRTRDYTAFLGKSTSGGEERQKGEE